MGDLDASRSNYLEGEQTESTKLVTEEPEDSSVRLRLNELKDGQSCIKEAPTVDNCEQTKMNFHLLVALMEVVGLIAIGMVTAWMGKYRGGWKWDGSGLEFNYHPVFMVVGLVFFYGNGAIAYRVFRTQDKFKVKLVHGAIHSGAIIFAILGLVTVFDFHNVNHIPNLYSLHSWIGLATVILFACQLVVGAFSFLFPKLPDGPRASYLVVHVYFGVGIFLMAIAACLTGMTEKLLFSIKPTYPKFVPEGNLANTLGLVLILFAGLVLVIVLTPAYKRPPPTQQQSNEYTPIKSSHQQ